MGASCVKCRSTSADKGLQLWHGWCGQVQSKYRSISSAASDTKILKATFPWHAGCSSCEQLSFADAVSESTAAYPCWDEWPRGVLLLSFAAAVRYHTWCHCPHLSTWSPTTHTLSQLSISLSSEMHKETVHTAMLLITKKERSSLSVRSAMLRHMLITATVFKIFFRLCNPVFIKSSQQNLVDML